MNRIIRKASLSISKVLLLALFGPMIAVVLGPIALEGAKAATTTINLASTAQPDAIAFDTAGNAYVADREANSHKILKITPGGVISDFATVGIMPHALVFDLSGNLYVTNSTDNNVSKISPTGVVTSFSNTQSYPFGVGIDAQGNIYAANLNSNSISKITASGSFTPSFAPTGANPMGIAVDYASGTVYAANFGASTLTKVTSTGVTSTITVGSKPAAMAFDAAVNHGSGRARAWLRATEALQPLARIDAIKASRLSLSAGRSNSLDSAMAACSDSSITRTCSAGGSWARDDSKKIRSAESFSTYINRVERISNALTWGG